MTESLPNYDQWKTAAPEIDTEAAEEQARMDECLSGFGLDYGEIERNDCGWRPLCCSVDFWVEPGAPARDYVCDLCDHVGVAAAELVRRRDQELLLALAERLSKITYMLYREARREARKETLK